MLPTVIAPQDIFPHVRIILGVVISLGMTRLLSGIARIMQSSGPGRIYPVHLAWVASLLIGLALFWWFEIRLLLIDTWTFGIYALLIAYAITFFLLCATLFPDGIHEQRGYEEHFHAQRGWFFGLLAVNYLLDVADTVIKGAAHYSLLERELLWRTPVVLALCLAAALTGSRRFHALLVTAMLLYQISLVWRYYDTLI